MVGVAGMSLSGGQKQRIGLARAIYGEPKMVILDEPNSNLDDAGEYALMMALRIMKERGVTVLFVTHKTNLLGLADKLILMQDGLVTKYDTTQEVLASISGENEAVKKISKEAEDE